MRKRDELADPNSCLNRARDDEDWVATVEAGQPTDPKATAGRPPRETQATISRWIEETFGPAGTNARVVARANEEMAELIRSVSIDDRHSDLAEEMADVVIVLYRVATRLGVNLLDEIDKKMATNRQRSWDLDGSGCGYHKE